MGLPHWAWVKKTVHGVKMYWLSSKEKVPSAVISKKGNVDSLLRHKTTHHHLLHNKLVKSIIDM